MPKDDFRRPLQSGGCHDGADLSGTFRVTARRSDKNYFTGFACYHTSKWDSRILTANKNLSVDVKKPQHTMNVEIRDMAYLYVKAHSGGRAVCPIGHERPARRCCFPAALTARSQGG